MFVVLFYYGKLNLENMKKDNKYLGFANLSNMIYMIIGFLLIVAFLIIVMVFVNSTNGLGLDPTVGLGWKFSSSELGELSKNLAIERFGYDAVSQNASLIDNAKIEILNSYYLRDGTYIFNGTNLPPWETILFVGFGLMFIILAIINGFRMAKAKDEELTILTVVDIFLLHIATGIFIYKYKKDKNGGEHLA